MRLQPQNHELAWRRGIDKQLDDKRGGNDLEPSVPYSASPFGGSGPPDALWYVPVTAALLDGSQASQPWILRLDRVCRMGLALSVPWKTAAGTSGELRLAMPGASNSPTATIALPAASTGRAAFRWLHGWPPWTGTDPWTYVEARRTGGAGVVSVGPPLAWQMPPMGCTVGGV